MNYSVNSGFWVIIMSMRFINCNKGTTVMKDVDNAGGYVGVGAEGI